MRPNRRNHPDFQPVAAPFETKPIPFAHSDNRMRTAVILAGGLLAIAAVATVVLSAVPLDVLKARLDAMAPDGTADQFPLERIAGIVWKLRLFGALALGSAVALVAKNRQVGHALAGVAGAAIGFAVGVTKQISRWVKSEEKVHLAALGLVFFAGIVARLWFLGQPMRDDEAATFLEFGSKPFLYGISFYPAPNNHILHTVLVHASCLLFGCEPWAIRLPAFVAGLLLIPVAYCTARIFYDRHAALLTACFVCVSSPLILYSTNARGYTIVCLLFLATLAAAFRLAGTRDRGAWIWLVMLFSLGLFTTPVMLYGVCVVMVWLAWSGWAEQRRGNRPSVLPEIALALAAVSIGTVVLYTPALVASGAAPVLGNGALAPYPWTEFPGRLRDFAHSVWSQWNMDLNPLVQWLCLAGAAISLVLHRRLARHRIPLILAVLLGCAPVLIAQRSARYARVFLFLLPVYLMLASAGISAMFRWLERRNKSASYLAIAVFVVFVLSQAGYIMHAETVYHSNETGTLRDAEQISAFLRVRLRDGDRVLPDRLSMYILRYYFLRDHILPVYLDPPTDPSERLIVVSGRKSSIDAREVLDRHHIDVSEPVETVMLREFPESVVYEIRAAR
jgi:dolichyl-phosphate-mannose-protein mannosyltransferase